MPARTSDNSKRSAPIAGLALALLGWSLVPLAVLLIDVLRNGGVLSGSDGMLAGSDQLFYLGEVREAGSNLLISNRFRIGSSDAVYLHPMFVVSGLFWRAGLGIQLALFLWKPVAAAALAAGVWGLVRTRFATARERLAAAVLGIFFVSPVLAILVWTDVDLSFENRLLFEFLSGEAMPALELWGYLHAALAIGLLALAVLAMERVLAPDSRCPGRSRDWYLVWGSLAGMVASWIHPWQGATLIAILAGTAAWGRLAPRHRLLLVPIAAAALPIAYLLLLGQIDPDWELANERFLSPPHAPLWMLLAVLGPLLVPALFAVRFFTATDGDRMLLLWIPAAFAVYLLTSKFPYHALQGISIPLAILAVRGFGRARLPALAGAAAVAVLTVPGVIHMMQNLRNSLNSGISPYVLENGENEALGYLVTADRPGGVLARPYLGAAVPAHAGRDTWVGQRAWTPGYERRVELANELFNGGLPPQRARRLVTEAAPAYLLADCAVNNDLRPLLGSLVVRRIDFGCASVYEVRPGL